MFYAPSPRAVGIDQAKAIVYNLAPFVTVVGLFVNAQTDEIQAVLNSVRIDLLQFHGEEDAAQCRSYGKPYIKAIRMRNGMAADDFATRYADASDLLLDSYQEGTPGGTGKRFDWAWIPREATKPIILAGGLTPENVSRAITRVQPYAVDVSGGVEAAKGIKDAAKIAAFMRGINDAKTI